MAVRSLGNKERKVTIVSVTLKKNLDGEQTSKQAFSSQHQRKISQMDSYRGPTFNRVL